MEAILNQVWWINVGVWVLVCIVAVQTIDLMSGGGGE